MVRAHDRSGSAHRTPCDEHTGLDAYAIPDQTSDTEGRVHGLKLSGIHAGKGGNKDENVVEIKRRAWNREDQMQQDKLIKQ